MTLRDPDTIEQAEDQIAWHKPRLAKYRRERDAVMVKATQRHVVWAYLIFRAARAAGRHSDMPGLYARTRLPR